MDISDFRTVERNLFVEAFAGIDSDHKAVAQFHAAFKAYARLSWCNESDANPKKGIMNALVNAAMMCGWSWPKDDPLPESQEETRVFHCYMTAAIVSFPNNQLHWFFDHIRKAGKDASNVLVVREAIVDMLQHYSWRASKGLSMSPDPW